MTDEFNGEVLASLAMKEFIRECKRAKLDPDVILEVSPRNRGSCAIKEERGSSSFTSPASKGVSFEEPVEVLDGSPIVDVTLIREEKKAQDRFF
mmetsp:Transcript_29881/g.40520  ORF Transcript_29881/g.40520 Transcript_29881/m.40520 type:complete len:94 (+) Transcript_29881:887-1168(+)